MGSRLQNKLQGLTKGQHRNKKMFQYRAAILSLLNDFLNII